MVTAAVTLGTLTAMAVLADVAGATTLFVPAPARATISQTAGVSPLFRVRGMSPGERYTACVDVAVKHPSADARVFLAGQDVQGPLAPALQLAVDAGPADGTTCAAFSAEPVYRGTVATLGADATSATATDWEPTGDGTWRFKFTVWARPDAPFASFASVGFAWRLSSAGVPVPLPAPRTPAPPSSAVPVPLAPGGGSGPTGAPPSERVPEVVLGRGHPTDGRTPAARLLAVLTALLRHPVYPSALLAVALLFVLLQDTVDRRDPKLALAPLRNDDLHFGPRPEEVQR